MTVIVALIGLVDLVVLAALLVALRRVRSREAALLRAKAPVAFAAGRSRLITVEITNPLELAATYTRFAPVAGAVAPDTLRRIVYDRAASIMREQLRRFDVEADVQVYVAD